MINIENDVLTKFDKPRQMCIYTLRQGHRSWTVEIPLAKLHCHAGNKMMRRKVVENTLTAAMSGPADGER